MGSLALNFLGDLSIARNGEPLELPPSRKTRALLAYLALTGRAFRREHLCELLWEIPDVEYVYSTSSPGRAMVVARFLVGEEEERALVRLNQKLAANASLMPPGASPPVVQLRAIDDVPVMSLTLWGPRYDDTQLRQFAAQLRDTLKWLAANRVDVVLIDPQYSERLAADEHYTSIVKSISDVARGERVLVVHRFGAMADLAGQMPAKTYLAADRFHLNDLGYRCMAEYAARAIVAGILQAEAEQTPKN